MDPQSSSRRFAITCTDRYIGIFEAFLNLGWQPVKIFTSTCDDRIHSNKAVLSMGESLGIDIQLSRLDERALEDLRARDCDVLVIASYRWRIGDWSEYIPKAINFHPSLLPSYRGPHPQPRALLDGQSHWGVSCHKVVYEFDQGDILAQQKFAIADQEDLETLDLKTQMAARDLACKVAGNLDTLWNEALPQGPGHYVGMWTDRDRTLDFTQKADSLSRQLRAFGRIGCLAEMHGTIVHIQQAAAWPEHHRLAPGFVAHIDGPRFVIACQDGFVAFLTWGMRAPV